MKHTQTIVSVLYWLVTFSACAAGSSWAEQETPPPGYYDIPPGYDFPADKKTLEQYRSTGNLSGQRNHVWHIFAGMTQSTPDGKYPVFLTWYSEDETFQSSVAPPLRTLHHTIIRFRQPNQFRTPPGELLPQVAGTALLSFVLYNYPAYAHIRSANLYRISELETLLRSGQGDPAIKNNRDTPAFPATAVVLKTIWWPVAKDKTTAMPIWDPEANPPRPSGNDYTTWARVVAIDPTRTGVPPNAETDISFSGKNFPKSHLVGLDAFYYIKLDKQTAESAMQDPAIASAAQITLGRSLQAGDYTVFAGTHLTTKEIDDWVWATFWWHDRPNDGDFAADRTADVKGVWRNYLMSASYDLTLPLAPDRGPHVTFNPWLEARFRDGGNGGGVVSNCMNCHNRASYPATSFLPVYRGNPDLQKDPAFAAGRLRTDFLWSIPDQSQ